MVASSPGSSAFCAIISRMTFDPLERKVEGEPGRFLHVINGTLHQHRRECMVRIDKNLRKGDQVLQRGYIGESTKLNSYIATPVFQVFLLTLMSL